MVDKDLSQDALEEIAGLLLPNLKQVRTLGELTSVALFIDGLIMSEDEYESDMDGEPFADDELRKDIPADYDPHDDQRPGKEI